MDNAITPALPFLYIGWRPRKGGSLLRVTLADVPGRTMRLACCGMIFDDEGFGKEGGTEVAS